MARSGPRLLLFCSVFFVVLLVASPRPVEAQPEPDWIHDTRLWVYLEFNGRPVPSATADNPIQVNMTGPMHLLLRVNNSGPKDINMSAYIVIYYQGVAVLTVGVRDPGTGFSFVIIPHGVELPPAYADINIGELLVAGGIQIATGLFQASMDFYYNEVGESPVYHLLRGFYMLVPASPASVLTSVAGIATTVFTAGAVFGLGNNFYTLLDGLRTASKMRTIQKKAAEIRSLPNLTVLGALPLLFSIVREMKTKKKTKDDATEGVSGYMIKQRLREVAPDAWKQDLCPKCKSKWDRSLGKCKKCGIDADDAKRSYGDLLTTKVEPSLRLLSKKKSLSVRKIAKKTKSNNYNAGVIGAAFVDTGVVEVTKIETPIRGFAMNMAGLGFLIVTWDQLLGYGSSQWQTTLTIVTAALSVGVIFALYFARRTQIAKMQKALEAGRPLMPTEAERESAKEEMKGGPVVGGTEEVNESAEATEPEEDKDQS